MELTHHYRVITWWTSGRTGIAKTDSAPNALHFTAPPHFGGLEGRDTGRSAAQRHCKLLHDDISGLGGLFKIRVFGSGSRSRRQNPEGRIGLRLHRARD